MRRRPRQISFKECYTALGLEKGADLAAVKRAYRRRAFELHPDLNPNNPEASRQFQLLNEAYVALSAVLKPAADAREKEEARRRAASARDNAEKVRTKRENAEQREKTTQDAAQDTAQTSARASAQTTTQSAQARQTAQAGQSTQSGQNAQGGQNAQSAHAGHRKDDAAGDQTRGNGQERQGDADTARNAYAEQDVLRDLLNDPFARRVFEDIYSELNRQQADSQDNTPGHSAAGSGNGADNGTARPGPSGNVADKTAGKATVKEREKKSTKLHQGNLAWGTPKWNGDLNRGVKGVVKDWLRRQIDEEQSLTLPAANLTPGRRVRLQIRRGLSGELHTVEITLPPDFAVGKPVRLRGLGKRVGPWQGDLYLTLYNE